MKFKIGDVVVAEVKCYHNSCHKWFDSRSYIKSNTPYVVEDVDETQAEKGIPGAYTVKINNNAFRSNGLRLATEKECMEAGIFLQSSYEIY